MSPITRLVLLCAVTLTVTALSAGPTFAQTITGIGHEDGGACNPCVIHISGESELHAGTIRLSTCEDELEAELYDAPTAGHWGHVVSYINADHESYSCTREAGETPAGAFIEWPIINLAETGNETVMMTIPFSFQIKASPLGNEDLNGEFSCPLELNLVEDHAGHRHTLSTGGQCPSGGRWTVDWEIEADSVSHDGIVFHHSDD